MAIDHQNGKWKVELLDNCTDGESEGVIVNLHPHLAIPGNEKHLDMAFPWLREYHQIGTKLMQERSDKGPHVFDIAYGLDGVQSMPARWSQVKKAWSLFLNGKMEHLPKALQDYPAEAFKTEHHTLSEALFNFGMRLLLPGMKPLFHDAAGLISEISQKHESEFRRFCKWFAEEMWAQQFKKAHFLFSEYFDDFSEFGQTLTYLRSGIELPDHYVATSASFQRTKMFYGNAYELLTNSLVFLACLNNILNGRSFDQFNAMTLDKYLTIDKAHRANPFASTPQFFAFAASIESTLRNASHHGAIDIEGDTITYRTGGTGALRTMSYAQYLHICNRTFLAVVALQNLEIMVLQLPNA